MNKSTKLSGEKNRRRSFLKGAALSGVALGAGVAAGRALGEAAPEPSAPVKPDGNKGYRETSHIREYYRLARF